MKKSYKLTLLVGFSLAAISCNVSDEFDILETVAQNTMKCDRQILARYSNNELNETMNLINSVLESKSGTSVLDNISNIYVDEMHNCIKVGLLNDDESSIADFKTSIFDSPSLVFEQASRVNTRADSNVEPEYNNPQRNALLAEAQPSYTLRAWHQVWGKIANNDSINSASVGYRAQTATGQKGFVTSAHAIMRLNDSVYVRGTDGKLSSVGFVQKRQNGGKMDAVFCAIDENRVSISRTLTDLGFPIISYSTSVSTELPAADLEVRLYGTVTAQGKGTYSGGKVVSSNSTFIGFGNVVYTNMVKATYPSYGGDCGGVVVTVSRVLVDPAQIRGIHLGRQEGFSYFVPVQTINATFGLTIY